MTPEGLFEADSQRGACSNVTPPKDKSPGKASGGATPLVYYRWARPKLKALTTIITVGWGSRRR
jgi:hypothetical protein